VRLDILAANGCREMVEAGRFLLGHRHRPGLLQVDMMLSTLDPNQGSRVVVAVVSGKKVLIFV